MDEDKSFLGTGWCFPPRFNKHIGGVLMVSMEEDIEQSLRILLRTAPGERTMNLAFGCGLHSVVFDSITESTIAEIKDTVERAILFFEPRITLENIHIDTGQQYEGILKINLTYTIRSTNSRSNMVYPYYFREGTDIAT